MQLVNGILLTFVDVSAFTWIVEMWDANPNPIMLTLFLSLVIGMSIGPIVIRPYLSFFDENENSTALYHEASVIFTHSAAVLGSAIYAAAALSYLFSIIIAFRIRSVHMLFLQMISTMIACFILLLSLHLSQKHAAWIAIVMIGISHACLLPTAYSYLSEKMIVTATMFGYITLAKAVVCITIPAIVGSVIELHPNIYVHINIMSIAIALCILMMIEHSY
jgi:hypothetical protein